MLAMILLAVSSLCVKHWIQQEHGFWDNYALLNWIHSFGRSYWVDLKAQKQNYTLTLAFPFLYTAMLLTLINIGFIASFILLRRWLSIKKWNYTYTMKEKARTALLEYLYGDSEKSRQQMEKINTRILVKEMIGLRQQIIGQKSKQLQVLFYEMDLDKFVIKKIKTSRWFNKIVYIDIAQWMRVNEALDIIRPYQYVDNPYLRNAAQVACVNLDTGNSFAFLNILEFPLPVWHQITLHKTMVRNSIPQPDFYSFLNSENDSVVIFALNMIRLFSQKGAEERIIHLIAHPDAVVRRHALRVVRDLKIYNAIETIKERFHRETLRNQIGMVHALALEKPQETFEFYKSIWVETPYRVQTEILKHVAPVVRTMLVKELAP